MKKQFIWLFTLLLVFAFWGCDELEDALDEQAEDEPPSRPSFLEVELTESNTIEISWQDNSDAEDGFIIQVKINDGSWEEIADISRNRASFTLDEVEENSSYLFRVKAYNEEGDSDWYTTISALEIPIFPPTELTGYGDDETIILEWIDNSNVEEGYRIERRGSSGGEWTNLDEVDGDVATYTDADVEVDTDYEYRVCAYVGSDLSQYSNNVMASTASVPTDVNAPSDLVALPDEAQVNLSWRDNSDNEDEFIIERMASGEDWLVLETTEADVTTYEDRDVITDIQYTYRVKAKAGNSYSAYSNTSTVTINSEPSDLEPPSNLEAQAYETGVDLTWEDNSEGETGYYVQRSLGSEGWETIAEIVDNSESYTDEDNIQPTSIYHYRVSAFGEDSNVSDPSNTATVEIPFHAPTNLRTAYIENDNQVRLTWDDNSNIEAGYMVFISENGGGWEVFEALYDVNITQFLDDHVLPGSYYEYRVVAIWNEEIVSDYSNTSGLLIPSGGDETTIYFSDFDDETVGDFPQGWNYSVVPAVTARISDEMDYGGSGKSIKFVDPSEADWGTLSLPVDVEDDYTEMEISFKLFFAQREGTLAFVPHMDDEDWEAAGFLQFEENGMVLGIDGPNTYTLMERYDINRWYRIRMVFNVETYTYDIFIDDELMADDYAFIYQDDDEIYRLDFNMWNDRSLPSAAYVDEFEVKILGE